MNIEEYHQLIWWWMLLGVIAFLVLTFIKAPYGKHIRSGWGPTVGLRLGWAVMESITLITMLYCLTQAISEKLNISTVSYVLLFLWCLHYMNRSWIWPLRARVDGKRIPVVMVLCALGFNFGNAWLNGQWLFYFNTWDDSWFTTLPFIIGVCCFVVGMVINIQSDNILFHLRSKKQDSASDQYLIPYGGLYRWVSCPNYLGECLQWIGWAIATWSLAGLAFAFWTLVNLIPRTIANHKWYKEHFADYPTARKRLIPYIW